MGRRAGAARWHRERAGDGRATDAGWIEANLDRLYGDAHALTRDADWLEAEAGGEADAPATRLGTLHRFSQTPVIPNLEGARLTIARVRFSDQGGNPVPQIGYRGAEAAI